MSAAVAGVRPRPPRFLGPYRYFAVRYLRTWRGSLTTTILYPTLYLLAMGVGLGHLVDAHLAAAGETARLGSVTYVQFLAPGLLAATAMQWGANESMYPIMAGLKWLKTYHAIIATPVEVTDLVWAHLAWVGTRVAGSAALFLAVMAAFGDVVSPYGVLALGVAVLVALAFGAPVAAFTATQETDTGLALIYRLGLVPLFLFSGTFFPISQLPGGLQAVARLTPLYHAVALSRSLVLGQLHPADLAHLAYLLGLLAVGTLLARAAFRRRLVV